jgi:hypothetical protein
MPEFDPMFNLVSNLGALGFIFWLVWRTTNHTIPRLAEDFQKGLKEARDDYRMSSKQQRDDLCKFFAEQLASERSKIDRLVDSMRDR